MRDSLIGLIAVLVLVQTLIEVDDWLRRYYCGEAANIAPVSITSCIEGRQYTTSRSGLQLQSFDAKGEPVRCPMT